MAGGRISFKQSHNHNTFGLIAEVDILEEVIIDLRDKETLFLRGEDGSLNELNKLDFVSAWSGSKTESAANKTKGVLLIPQGEPQSSNAPMKYKRV